jgi:hypothetical protein
MRTIKQLLLLTVLLTSISACKKTYEEPPENQLPIGNVITIADLKDMYSGPGSNLEISEDYSIYANVTTEETNGNFYKEAFIQDASGAIKLAFSSACGLYIGDSIRLNVNGTILNDYGSLIQVENIDPYTNVVKIATNRSVEPELLTMQQLNTTLHQSKLIKLDNVEFATSDLNLTFADGINLTTTNRNLTDCGGNSILVRTSGYANFAKDTIPSLNGSITGVMSIYNSDIQLYIRDINEIDMIEERCTGGVPLLLKNFEDENPVSGGWSIQNVLGNIDWTTNTAYSQFGDAYGQITNYTGGGNSSCETWLISPSVDLSSVANPIFSFQNAYKYNGNSLEVYVSNDYDGTSDPSTQGTWNQLQATLSTGNFDWVSSGNIDLTSYAGTNTYVAFKYTGSSSDGSTWEIDEIMITE